MLLRFELVLALTAVVSVAGQKNAGGKHLDSDTSHEQESSSIINRLDDLERKYSWLREAFFRCSEKLDSTSRRERETATVLEAQVEQLSALRSLLKIDNPTQKSATSRRLSESGKTARLIFDGERMCLNAPLNISGEFASESVTASGVITGSSLTDGTAMISGGAIASATTIAASGAITGNSLTDGTATISGGAIASATTITASGAITGNSLTDGTATISGGAIASATTVTASGVITGGSLTVGGDSTFSGQVDITGSLITTQHYAFNAYVTTAYWSAGITIPFDATSLNEGSAFDTSLYRFTAPVTGLYWFHTHCAGRSSSGHFGFYVNSVLYNPAATSESSWETAAVGAAMSLSQNDYVEVKSWGTSGGLSGPDGIGAYYAGFSGFLVAQTA